MKKRGQKGEPDYSHIGMHFVDRIFDEGFKHQIGRKVEGRKVVRSDFMNFKSL